MKAALSFCCLFFLMACADNAPPPTEHKEPAARHDTLPIHKEALNPYAAVDVSPMDISYFPEDYPVMKMSERVSGPPLARVIYSRPHRQGRTIFGGLLQYGKPWRLGANEATEIELFKDATILGKKVPAGRYILYCVPEKESWTICFNSNIYSWGLRHDEKMDVQQFRIPISQLTQPIEYFSLVFQKTAAGADMVMAWDTVEARLPFSF
ncbi:MAG: hypothetical protein JWP27_1469 [Flaviaesturariibacter sp.]|nr:hypothetical protein [Flaviaesturariibacter sp.]